MEKSTQPETTEAADTTQPSVPGTGRKKFFVVLLIAIALLIVIAITRRPPEPVTPIEPDVPVVTMPTVPDTMPAEPVKMATSPIPMDQPNLLGLLRIRDMRNFPERLGSFLQTVQPELDPTMLSNAMADAGMNPQHARSDGNAALFAWKPDPIISTPDLIALLPLRASAIDSSTSFLPSHFASVEGCPESTLLAWEHADLAVASPISAKLREIAQAPIDGDFAVTLNLRRIWQNYGTIAKLYARTAQGAVGIGLMQQPALAEHPQAIPFLSELINAASATIFEALEQSLFATLNIGFQDEQMQVSLVSEAEPGTKLANSFSGGPLSAPDLLSLLPDSEHAMIVSQETVADWEPTLSIMSNVLRPAIATLGSKPTAQFDTMLKRIRECGPTTIATSMRPTTTGDDTGNPGLATECIILAGNPDAMHRLLKDQISYLFETGAYAQFYRLIGVKCELSTETVTIPSLNQPIHRFTITYAPVDDDSALLRDDIMAAFQQTNVYELAQSGPYVLLAMDTPVDNLAQHIATVRPAEMHPLFTNYEPGMASVGQLNVSAFTAMIERELEKEQHPLPVDAWPDPESLTPVTFATYMQDGVRTTKIRIPANILAGLGKLVDIPMR